MNRINLMISIFITITLLILLSYNVTSIYADKITDRFNQCHEYKQENISDVDRLVINCSAWANSDDENITEWEGLPFGK